jgi:hypothetical protein
MAQNQTLMGLLGALHEQTNAPDWRLNVLVMPNRMSLSSHNVTVGPMFTPATGSTTSFHTHRIPNHVLFPWQTGNKYLPLGKGACVLHSKRKSYNITIFDNVPTMIASVQTKRCTLC